MSGADQIYTPAPHAPSLLPSASPDWLLAHSLVGAARRPLPAHLVSDVWNPATCPLDLIPYQCAGLGLEIWDDTWPEAKQRVVYADLWRLKRNKTKLKGIAAYLDLVGAELVAAHVPKQRFWWSGGQSQAQRDATIAEMPRVRIFPFARPALGSPAKACWSGRSAKAFWRRGRCWVPSDAAARFAARASYVDGDVATPVTVRGLDGVLGASVVVELSAGASVAKPFWGRFAWGGGAAFIPSDAADHVLAITPAADAPGFAVPRGLVPSTVRPVRSSETAPASVAKPFWGHFAWGGGAAWLASDAADHVFDEVVLFDPARLAPARQHGWGRPWGRGYWRRSDPRPFWRAVAAVKVAKAVRDHVWIDTRLYRPIQFSAGLRFGDSGFDRFGDERKLT